MVEQSIDRTGPGIPEPHSLMRKPLPQILDEMDGNIRAAIEAARRAEEASRSAREAAAAAIKASGVDAEMSEAARKA